MPTTYTFTVQGMHCNSCSMLIDDELEDLPGVTRSTTSVRKATTVVEVDPTTVTAADIMAAIARVGDYTATQA